MKDHNRRQTGLGFASFPPILHRPMRQILLTLALLSPLPASGAVPAITWTSDPVRPDETVLLLGDGFGDDCIVELGQFPATPPASLKAAASHPVEHWEAIRPLQASAGSLKCVVPQSWPPGVWACRVRRGATVSQSVVLNVPEAWWFIGDGGESASPGGWLRVFGKSLGVGGASRALLQAHDGRTFSLQPSAADGYALRMALPADLAAGDYELLIHNGLGGNAAWRRAGRVIVRPQVLWKKDVFNVKDFGPRPEEALLAALQKAKANGGGVVFLPRGRYPVRQALAIPPHTILRGEAMELVSLYWPDFDDPPKELVSGADYGLESLALYCQHHRNVIADSPASQRFFAHQVRVRANCFFMIEDVGKEFRKRRGPASHKECGAAILLRGRNFEITDCDIYASNYAVRMLKARQGLIARSRLLYGGRGYSIENTERLIFEDNLISGNNLLSIGNDITTFWTNFCRHIYYAHNRVQQMFGADREMMTLDAAGGAYFGKIAGAHGAKLTLAADPAFRDYAPKPHTDWTGAAVQILDGKGAGQYRFVTAHAGREWQVDRPWTVEPDTASRISIAPFRGQNLFIGNTFEDGGAFQLYGTAHDSIVAGNRGARMDGFLVWGLNPHGWGQQPSWGCQFLDNEIVEGNGYGHRSASIGIVSGDDPKVYEGPLVRAAIFRRNILHNNARIAIAGVTEDVLVEHCTVRNTDLGIDVKPTARGVLLRENRFEAVRTPVQGPALQATAPAAKHQSP